MQIEHGWYNMVVTGHLVDGCIVTTLPLLVTMIPHAHRICSFGFSPILLQMQSAVRFRPMAPPLMA